MVHIYWQGYENVSSGLKMFDFIPLGVSFINTVKLEKTLYIYLLLWTIAITWESA